MAGEQFGYLFLVLSTVVVVCFGGSEVNGTNLVLPKRISSEQRLLRHLMDDYYNSVRPVIVSTSTVVVGLGLTITQILDVDEKNQVLTTNVWLEMEWYDEKLKWDPSHFDGVNNTRIPCRMLWLPDIVLYNSADDYTSGYMQSLAMVYNDGRVFWGPVVRFRSSCKIDITYFPFDDQICKLKMGSWAYNGLQVDITNRSTQTDLSNFVDNGEWELIQVKVTRNVVTYGCCDEPFPDVTFYIHLRRRIKYYLMNIILPCVILSILCLAGFLLPPESGEKITLGLSVLLTLTVFMLMVADKMPQTSESISVIGIYLMVVLSTSSLSVLSSVFVLSIYHQRGRPQKVPNLMKILMFDLVAKLLCVKVRRSTHPRRRQQAKDRVSCNKSRVGTGEEKEVIRLETKKESHEETFTINVEKKHVVPPEKMQILQFLGLLERKHAANVNEEEVIWEWRQIAMVTDRLLFTLFLLVTMISTTYIMAMRPPNLEL